MYVIKLFIFLQFLYVYSYGIQFDYIKLENMDKNNALLKVEKKNKLYEYVIEYKLEKNGYLNDNKLNTNFYDTSFYDLNNEDKQSVTFANSLYINDNIWLDLNFNYEDSLKKSIDNSIGLFSENKIYKQQSLAKLYFKQNSIMTSKLSFESINSNLNSNINIDTNGYRNLILKDKNKVSFDTKLGFDSIDVYTKIYQINDNYNKFYKDIDSDYIKNKNNISRGIELTFEKDFFESYLISSTLFRENNYYDYIYRKSDSNKKEKIDSESQGIKISIIKSFYDNLKLAMLAIISHNKIKNSNRKDLIGNKLKDKAEKQLNMNLEYKIKKIKLFSRLTHMSSRYANENNSKKLDVYTIASIGSSYYTKVKDKDIKFNFDIKNIFNKKYFIDSDTHGESRSYFFNMIMKF